jgi:hypothetical protein
MPANTYPTLDSVGFITNPRSKAERILTDYLGSNYSQSNIFLGRVKSLIYAIKNNTNNIVRTSNQVQDDLSTLFNAYLDSVTVEVQMEPITNANGQATARYDLQIKVQFLNNGIIESLGKTIQLDNTGFVRIATLEIS